MNELYDYVFWFNHYENLWYAIPRDQQLNFFNGKRENAKGVSSDKDIQKLIKRIK
jgi:hypothetical protein